MGGGWRRGPAALPFRKFCIDLDVLGFALPCDSRSGIACQGVGGGTHRGGGESGNGNGSGSNADVQNDCKQGAVHDFSPVGANMKFVVQCSNWQ
ncbi:hypothetical protein Bpro_1891 [Polaromonas sp. JS666]|nr:hypothetical protein Bpro_1891 [Polaromonas sp. JS666]